MDFQRKSPNCEFCLNSFESLDCILPTSALNEIEQIPTRRRKYSILLEAHQAITKEYETSTANLTKFVKDRVLSELMSTAHFEENPTPQVDVGTEHNSPSVHSSNGSQTDTPQTLRSLSNDEKANNMSSQPHLATKTSVDCNHDHFANSIVSQKQHLQLEEENLPDCLSNDINLSTSSLDLLNSLSSTKLALPEFLTSFKAQLDAICTKTPLHEKHFHKRDKILNLIFNTVISSHTIDGSIHRYIERHQRLSSNSQCIITHIILSYSGRNQMTMNKPQDVFTTYLSHVRRDHSLTDPKFLDKVGLPQPQQETATTNSQELVKAPPLAASSKEASPTIPSFTLLTPLKTLHQMRIVPGHSCPSLSPLLDQVLENQLIGLITRLLNEDLHYRHFPQRLDRLTRMMTCLTFEIVSHNTKWLKTSFILSRSLLLAASNNLVLDASDDELSQLYLLMPELLSQLRTNLPLRHFT